MSLHALLTMPVVDASSAQVMFLLVQQKLHERDLSFRSPPPEPTTCCGRGCNGCVWEGFVTAANYWRDDALALLNQSLKN